MIKLNKRLQQIGDLVEANSFCLDIGCDHAFLDIYLVQKGKDIHTIASDVGEGPLLHAKENIKKYHLEKEIETRLGNGLDTYSEGIDTVIISGMGGRTMIGIFKAHLEVLKKLSTIIISPNNYQEDVKRFLTRHGFIITEELLVKEGKYIYQIIKLGRGKKRYTRKEFFFGPKLLENKGTLFFDYYSREIASRKILLTVLPKNYRFKKFFIRREIKLLETEIKQN